MSTITFNRSDYIRRSFDKIRTSSGIVSTNDAMIYSQITSALSEAFDSRFQEIYSLSSQLDISTADGAFLDNWLKFYNESRERTSYAADLTLSNVSIGFSDGSKAMDNTVNGGDYPIPSGTYISDENEKIYFKTLDDTVIRAEDINTYVRVIADKAGQISVSPKTLTKVHTDLTIDTSILKTRAGKLSLISSNAFEITGGMSINNDEELRYILDQKRQSIGLFNTKSVNTLIDIKDIVSFKIDIARGIINIYIDTVDRKLNDLLVEIAEEYLNDTGIEGMYINVLPSVYKRVKLNISVASITNIVEDMDNIKVSLITEINNIRMGSSINFNNILKKVITPLTNIKTSNIDEVYLDSRLLIGTEYVMKFNEKPYIEYQDISIK